MFKETLSLKVPYKRTFLQPPQLPMKREYNKFRYKVIKTGKHFNM